MITVHCQVFIGGQHHAVEYDNFLQIKIFPRATFEMHMCIPYAMDYILDLRGKEGKNGDLHGDVMDY